MIGGVHSAVNKTVSLFFVNRTDLFNFEKTMDWDQTGEKPTVLVHLGFGSVRSVRRDWIHIFCSIQTLSWKQRRSLHRFNPNLTPKIKTIWSFWTETDLHIYWLEQIYRSGIPQIYQFIWNTTYISIIKHIDKQVCHLALDRVIGIDFFMSGQPSIDCNFRRRI